MTPPIDINGQEVSEITLNGNEIDTVQANGQEVFSPGGPAATRMFVAEYDGNQVIEVDESYNVLDDNSLNDTQQNITVDLDGNFYRGNDSGRLFKYDSSFNQITSTSISGNDKGPMLATLPNGNIFSCDNGGQIEIHDTDLNRLARQNTSFSGTGWGTMSQPTVVGDSLVVQNSMDNDNTLFIDVSSNNINVSRYQSSGGQSGGTVGVSYEENEIYNGYGDNSEIAVFDFNGNLQRTRSESRISDANSSAVIDGELYTVVEQGDLLIHSLPNLNLQQSVSITGGSEPSALGFFKGHLLWGWAFGSSPESYDISTGQITSYSGSADAPRNLGGFTFDVPFDSQLGNPNY